jgi:uncharacterized protein (TIGR03435 family)
MMRYRRNGFALVITTAVVGSLHGQPAPNPAYTYDVVSIHKADPAERNSGFSPGPQSGLHARNDTAMQLLTFAFEAREYQFVGVPGWAKTDRFEIDLTPDRSEAPLPDHANQAELDGWLIRNRQRLQAVLRDRFGLVVRRETREMPLYALTVSKGGHKLSAPADTDRGVSLNINGGQQIVARSSTMKQLADSLAMLMGRFVRDETGLDGSFDFKMDFSRDSTGADVVPRADAATAGDRVRPSIFAALTEQLGLRLEAKKGPVPILVVEKLDRPTEN